MPFEACDGGGVGGGRQFLAVADCGTVERGIEQQFTVRKAIKIQISDSSFGAALPLGCRQQR